MSETILTIDIGTSSTKTTLWNLDGQVIDEAPAAYPLTRPQPAWAEIDAAVWWAAACDTAQTVLRRSGTAAHQVAGIGVDGVGWTLAPVDETGQALFPALIWLDRRAETQAAALRGQPEASALVNLAANPLDAAYITPKLLWLKQHFPGVFDQAHKFLTSSGYIVSRMTGEFVCDYTQAYGYHFFDIRRERWDAAAAGRLGIPLQKMPELRPPTALAGQLTRQAAGQMGLRAGIPVIAGALDASVGAFGAGAVRVGQTVDQGGQAGGMLMCVDQVVVEPRLIFAHHILPGHYLFQSGTVGGGILGWFRDLLRQTGVELGQWTDEQAFATMSAQAASSVPGAHGLVLLPYMAGERTPLWNSSARGVLFGLSYATTLADMLRAFMEGCAYAVYHNLKIAEQQQVTVREWIGIGGAAHSALWNQIKADVTGRPFVVKRQRSGKPGGHALGLFVMVEAALGRCLDMAGRVEALLPEHDRFEPHPAAHALYQDLFETYLSLADKLAPDFDRLAEAVERHSQPPEV